MSTGPTDSTASVPVSVPVSRATVRPAGAADVSPVAAVAAATFELACPPSMTRDRVEAFVDEVLSPERFADYVADPTRQVLLAETGGTVLGYAMLVRGEPSDDDVRATIRLRPTVELSKIYVLPQAHGTGAAALLMARALEWARATGAAGVWLGVNQQNERAQRFYGKSGFERVGTKRFLVGGVYEDDYVMERALDPRP
ncbi:GNAT family N-acetyltransferase [Terrabacter sp. 2YAF2]|uniref:GNAT family N-acetyltransferase n=1 Tax=Terrabacter sp. 2YAF2 TaxID=3233026 RepID=UPI003F964D71